MRFIAKSKVWFLSSSAINNGRDSSLRSENGEILSAAKNLYRYLCMRVNSSSLVIFQGMLWYRHTNTAREISDRSAIYQRA
jgi:hypothetical protein